MTIVLLFTIQELLPQTLHGPRQHRVQGGVRVLEELR